MGLVTTRVCVVLLAAVLTFTLATEQTSSRQAESRWSKPISDRRSSSMSSDWVPLPGPCKNCQPNDRISEASDDVSSLLTPPLPDYQIPPSFLPPKQFHEHLRPIAQQLVQQQNGHQQFLPPVQQEFPPKFQRIQDLTRNAQKPDARKPFVQNTPPQFIQQPNIGLQFQQNVQLGVIGQNPFAQQVSQPEFTFTQSNTPIELNTDPNQLPENQYQPFLGQFLQPQQEEQQQQNNPVPKATNESHSSSEEEKPEVQLVYVPVEALRQRGRFINQNKPTIQTLTEPKNDLQLQQQPSALAAEESQQQQQQFQQHTDKKESQKGPQIDTQKKQPTENPQVTNQLLLSTAQPQQEENHFHLQQQSTQSHLHLQRPHPTSISQHDLQPEQQSTRQHLLHPLRTFPTGIPQQLHQQHLTEQLSEQQLAVPILRPQSVHIPQLQLHHFPQHQIQDHNLAYENPFIQTQRPHPTQIPHIQQLSHENPFVQTQRLQPTRIPQVQLQQPQRHQIEEQQLPNEDQFDQTRKPFQQVTEEPQIIEQQFHQSPTPVSTRTPQTHQQTVTPQPTRQPFIQNQRLLQTTRKPQIPNVEEQGEVQQQEQGSPLQQSTTIKPAKPIPHQPPLSVYMGKGGNEVKITDVIKVLKAAKTIAVLDSVGPESPQVFVGPSNLQPPQNYAKFELPYLSSIESNRVERKVEQLPFFVAPLNFKPPPGYSKIPFPAPHIGSVVISNATEKEPVYGKDLTEVQTNKPSTRGRFSSKYSLPAELPAINPQLPKLVNSLQDSRQQGNVFLTPTNEQGNVQQTHLRKPFSQTIAQPVQQTQHEQPNQPFQEIYHETKVPQFTQVSPTQQLPEVNQYSEFQQVLTTPQTNRLLTTPQPHFQQVHHASSTQQPLQTSHLSQDQQLSQFPQTHQFPQAPEIPQFVQFTPTRQVVPNLQKTQHVSQAPDITEYSQFPEVNQVSVQQNQQYEQSNQVSQTPVIQQYLQTHEPDKQLAQNPVQHEEVTIEEKEVPTTPLPRIPKRRPSYRARQRTTEAPSTEETTTTTRRPFSRGRRPTYTRHRVQQQSTESQQDKPSTVSTHTQYQTEVESSSTPEYSAVPGLRYSTRVPNRSNIDGRLQSNRGTAQEDIPRRNIPPRSRSRTREPQRNSQRVIQNLPNQQKQNIEGQRQSINAQTEQEEFVVPPHESRREQQSFNRNYNTERSSFEEPTTENNQFGQVDNQNQEKQIHSSKHNIHDDDRVAYQQQSLPQFHVTTRQPSTEYQTSERLFPVSILSQQDSITEKEINYPVPSSTIQPDVHPFTTQNQPSKYANLQRTRVQSQTVNEEPVQQLHFTVPVQVTVSGQTEKPEIEETPRPVYVRVRGHTRGRNPQAQKTVPQYQQQQEGSYESLQKTVPQYQKAQVSSKTVLDQESFYPNQQQVNNFNSPNSQPQLSRQKTHQLPSDNIQDNLRSISTTTEEAEEEYGFIRPVSFPPQPANQEATLVDSQESTSFEVPQSQESLENVDDLNKTPVFKNRQNFLGRPRRPVKQQVETSTTTTTVYTVRPSRRPQVSKQQVRLTSVRGRIRRPTTTSEPAEVYSSESQAPTTESHFIRRRPINRFNPSVGSNKVIGEPQDDFVTPRSTLQRYDTQTRDAGNVRQPVTANSNKQTSDGTSTPSTFQITLLDEPPNYPPQFNERLQAQNQFRYQTQQQQARPEDLTSLNSDNVPTYLTDDPERGAESQWSSKRLPVYSGKEPSTIPYVFFTTEFPNVELTTTETPEVLKETVTSDLANYTAIETSSETVITNEDDVQQPTSTYPLEVTSKLSETDDVEKTLIRDVKEVPAQKKATDDNLNKKTGSGRRGTWVRVRKVQRPSDLLETAESQNFGALSNNQIRLMRTKGTAINSWPLPPSTLVLDDNVFEVPKLSPAEHYTTVNENASDQTVPSIASDDSYAVAVEEISEKSTPNIALDNSYLSVNEDDGAKSAQNIAKEINDYKKQNTETQEKSVKMETFDTTTESTVVTEESKGMEVTTLYVTPTSEDIDSAINTSLHETGHLTTENPIVETSTQIFEETKQPSVDSSNFNQTKFETEKLTSSEETDRKNEEHLLIQSSVRDAIQQNTPTEGTTEKPGFAHVNEDLLNEPTTTELNFVDADSPEEIIRTSMRTEVSHETEICFRGRCVKTKTADNDHLAE